MVRHDGLREPVRTAGLHAQVLAGDLATVTTSVQGLAQRGRHDGDPRALAHLLGRVGPYVAASRGRGRALREALKPPMAEVQGPLPGGWGLVGIAHLDLLEGQPQKSVQRLAAMEERVQSAFVDPWLRTAWARARGLLARAVGDGREVRRQADLLRKDDRPWAQAWADVLEARYADAAQTFGRLGWTLEQALATAHTDGGAQGPSGAWLKDHGVGNVKRMMQTFT